MVKVFDPDRPRYHKAAVREHKNDRIFIIVDLYREAHYGTGNVSTEENCINIAASLVKKYLNSGKRVG